MIISLKKQRWLSKKSESLPKKLIGQSIFDQLQKGSEVILGIAAGPSAADANWCPNSAKHQAFWGGARHNIKQKEEG